VKSFLSKWMIALVCLVSVAPLVTMADVTGEDSDANAPAQVQVVKIVVGGRVLTGPNAMAQRRAGRIFLPVSAIARALGDTMAVDAAARTVTVRRQNGVEADFDAASGRIRESGAVILSISNAGEVAFTPNVDAFLLPAEIAASLFDIAIKYDSDKNAVLVDRGRIAAAPSQVRSSRGSFELYQVDYEYNLDRYAASAAHNMVLGVIGRIGDGRFTLMSNGDASSDRGVALRRMTFTLDRANGQKYIAGDFGSGSNLQFMSANVRGGSVTIPFDSVTVTGFGGRSYSGSLFGVYDPLIPIELQPRKFNSSRYDTNIFGISATTLSGRGGHGEKPFYYSAGAMRFGSPGRSGEFVTGSVNYDATRIRLQADTAYGKFNGRRSDNSEFDGFAAALDLSGTYQVTDDLTVQARYTNIGHNFLSPQAGLREPLDLKAAGVTWSPARWLSTSLNASTARRPGDDTQNNKYVTAAVTITPLSGLPRVYFSHTESRTSQIRSGQFTTLNASQDFRRLRIFFNATRIKNLGPVSVNAQIGANYTINDHNSIEVAQGMGSRGARNGQFDWRTSNWLGGRLSFTAGVGYNYSQSSGTSTFERLSASLNLPKQTSLQVNYYQTGRGSTVLVSLRGSLFRRKESESYVNSPLSAVISYGKVSGRVYQDVDQDGRFDAAVDKPQADVKVRIDGNRYVVSDANGLYSFDSIIAGDHKVFLDLLSVRADLTLLDDSAKSTTLNAGHEATYDFRLVRTGRVSGRVWLDANGNGKFDKDETALGDVRVVTASGRDTLTDADGYFVIADMTPGEHIFLLDEKTLPEKTMAGSKPLSVKVLPGRETADTALPVIAIPAEIKHFSSRSKQ